MKVIYLAGVFTKKRMRWCHENIQGFHQMPGVKFHRLLARGFLLNGNSVDVLSSYHPKHLSNELDGEEDGIHYYYPNEGSSFSTYSFYCKKIKELTAGEKECLIICDILNITSSLAALKMSKKLKIKCFGIVTDLPSFTIGKGSLRTAFASCLANRLQKRFDGYILLTEYMNEVVNPSHKPYVISECVVDSDFQVIESKKERKKKCIYAGGISKQYGLPELIQGFIQSDLPDVELHLFGDGGYVKEFDVDELKKHRIFYRGVLANEEVLAEEKEASLLINPRSPLEEFTKYSFPSKNMEYMSTGTPMLGFKLPGIPKEYFDYMYTMDEFSSSSIADALKTIFSLPESEREKKGKEAQKFVLEHKNNIVVAKKIVELAKAK